MTQRNLFGEEVEAEGLPEERKENVDRLVFAAMVDSGKYHTASELAEQLGLVVGVVARTLQTLKDKIPHGYVMQRSFAGRQKKELYEYRITAPRSATTQREG